MKSVNGSFNPQSEFRIPQSGHARKSINEIKLPNVIATP